MIEDAGEEELLPGDPRQQRLLKFSLSLDGRGCSERASFHHSDGYAVPSYPSPCPSPAGGEGTGLQQFFSSLLGLT